MELSVESLRGAGGFAGAPVKKHIQWSIGENDFEADVYVRKLSYKSAVLDAMAIDGGDIAATRIAYCIVDEQGNPVFTVPDITGVNDDGSPVLDDNGEPRGALVDQIANELYRVIMDVNPMGKSRRSPRKKKSSTS